MARVLRRSLFLLLAGIVLAAAFTWFNNNVSLGPSRVVFQNRLEAARTASRDWVLDFGERQTFVPGDQTTELLFNPALLHMVVDSGRLSSDQRLQSLSARLFTIGRNPYWWARLLDPGYRFERPPAIAQAALPDYQRWFLYAIAPHEVTLSPVDRENLFSPEKFRLGHLTHQLMALYLYRRYNGNTPDVERMIGRLSARIAREEAIDFRVTDLYLQRIAILLAAGRPDLVRRRWVERAFAARQPDGGWTYSWYGWQPTPPYRFSFAAEEFYSGSHPTVQGMWIAYLLKYRYPEWIAKNYR